MTETRITDPSTGGQKGDKPRRYDLIPPDVLGELADHYVDEETGSNHLIAVAWHAFALRWFQLHGAGTDDIAGRQHARILSDIAQIPSINTAFYREIMENVNCG